MDKLTVDMNSEEVMEVYSDNAVALPTKDCAESASQAIFARVDKDTYQTIAGTLRYLSMGRSRCSCEYDCCGCVYKTSYKIERNDEHTIKIVHRVWRNY